MPKDRFKTVLETSIQKITGQKIFKALATLFKKQIKNVDKFLKKIRRNRKKLIKAVKEFTQWIN